MWPLLLLVEGFLSGFRMPSAVVTARDRDGDLTEGVHSRFEPVGSLALPAEGLELIAETAMHLAPELETLRHPRIVIGVPGNAPDRGLGCRPEHVRCEPQVVKP